MPHFLQNTYVPFLGGSMGDIPLYNGGKPPYQFILFINGQMLLELKTKTCCRQEGDEALLV